MEARASQGQSLKWVKSVASFFLSRIDVSVDPLLEKIMGQPGPQAELAGKAHGAVAIASAVTAYQIYQEIFTSERFKALEKQGASVQRLLWASTSTKNPDYSKLKYIEALIGPNTINTVPLETLATYRDHGQPRARLQEDVAGAASVLARLPDLGIDLDRITQQLEDEGVVKFNKAFDTLVETLIKKARHFNETQPGRGKRITYVT